MWNGKYWGPGCAIGLGSIAELVPGHIWDTTAALPSSGLSHLLILHLPPQQFLKCLCNCVHRVPASLPSSNSVLCFAAPLLLDNGHLAVEFSAVHLLGVFCPPAGKFAPVGLAVGCSAGCCLGFYCRQHLLSSPITPAHCFDHILYWFCLLLNSHAGSSPPPPGIWVGGSLVSNLTLHGVILEQKFCGAVLREDQCDKHV